MELSVGWFFLVGGALGAFRCATAKRFFKSDFASSDGVIPEEDYKKEVVVTLLHRWLLVGLCVVLAGYGALQIEWDHNWNPFYLVR